MRVGMQMATVREVAAFLRLKESTVCSLTSQGKLPGFKIGKSWRFDMDKVELLFAGIMNGGSLLRSRETSHTSLALPEKRAGRQFAISGKASKKVTHPEQVIPMNDGEFKDF